MTNRRNFLSRSQRLKRARSPSESAESKHREKKQFRGLEDGVVGCALPPEMCFKLSKSPIRRKPSRSPLRSAVQLLKRSSTCPPEKHADINVDSDDSLERRRRKRERVPTNSSRRRSTSPKAPPLRSRLNSAETRAGLDKNGRDLVPINRHFYKEHADVRHRSQREVDKYRLSNEIKISGPDRHLVPKPIQSFKEVPFAAYMCREMHRQGYQDPTPIQAQGWPLAMQGFNVVGIARTGSGKTLAYILPAIEHIRAQPPLRPGEGPVALILVPTRELAQQIQKEVFAYSDPRKLRSVCLFGGSARYIQKSAFTKGCELVVATPGRLLDLLSERDIRLTRCTYLVLDEADTMLDMGFEPQLARILQQARSDLQILMWSATWPRGMEKLAARIMPRFTQIHVGSLELAANHNITQIIEVLKEEEKMDRLKALLTEIYDSGDSPGKILVFAERKRRVDDLVHFIATFVRCEPIHGDKTQSERGLVLRDFRNGSCNILVATDLASRGLDVPGVKYVINYDFPRSIESYIHRIGRTGRSNCRGKALSFFTGGNLRHGKALIQILKEANQKINPKLQRLCDYYEGVTDDPGISESNGRSRRRRRSLSAH